jgi:hypothetical protein
LELLQLKLLVALVAQVAVLLVQDMVKATQAPQEVQVSCMYTFKEKK